MCIDAIHVYICNAARSGSLCTWTAVGFRRAATSDAPCQHVLSQHFFFFLITLQPRVAGYIIP